MRTNTVAWLAVCTGIGLALVMPAATAHHSFAAQYDSAKPVSLNGVVVKIEWLNPHAYFFIDVKDEETGEIATWACELTSPVGLMRQGWTRNSLKIGDVVEVDGILARDGGTALNARSVVLAETGQRLFARTAAEERASAEQTQ